MGAGQRFGELLRLLAAHGVELVVVGAAAAVLDGAPMTTFDLAIVCEPGDANRKRLLEALVDLDAVYWDPAGRRIEPTEGRLDTQRVHLFETRLGRLDVMREIGGSMGWGDAYADISTRAASTRSTRSAGISVPEIVSSTAAPAAMAKVAASPGSTPASAPASERPAA